MVLDHGGVMRHQNDRKVLTRRSVLFSKEKIVPGARNKPPKGDVTEKMVKCKTDRPTLEMPISFHF